MFTDQFNNKNIEKKKNILEIYVGSDEANVIESFGQDRSSIFQPVSYTHLTLPTIYSV